LWPDAGDTAGDAPEPGLMAPHSRRGPASVPTSSISGRIEKIIARLAIVSSSAFSPMSNAPRRKSALGSLIGARIIEAVPGMHFEAQTARERGAVTDATPFCLRRVAPSR
jgi:hypothetical protein